MLCTAHYDGSEVILVRTVGLAFLVLGLGFLVWAEGLLTPVGVLEQPNTVALAFSPDGSLLALARGNEIHLLRCEDWSEIGHLVGHTRPVTCVAFSKSGTLLVSSSWDGTVRLWDPATGELRREIAISRGASDVFSVAMSPDERIVVSGAVESGTGFAMVMWFEASTGRLMRSKIISLSMQLSVLGGGKTTIVNYVRSIRFSPDGALVAAGFTDKAVRVWDARGEELRVTFGEHAGTVYDIAFSPDGQRVAAASWREVVIWDIRSGTRVLTLTGHRNEVRAVAYAPDGVLLATGGYDGTLRLWNAATGQLVESIQVFKPKTGLGAPANQGILALAFSPDGRMLVAPVSDGRVHVWTVAKP